MPSKKIFRDTAEVRLPIHFLRCKGPIPADSRQEKEIQLGPLSDFKSGPPGVPNEVTTGGWGNPTDRVRASKLQVRREGTYAHQSHSCTLKLTHGIILINKLKIGDRLSPNPVWLVWSVLVVVSGHLPPASFLLDSSLLWLL